MDEARTCRICGETKPLLTGFYKRSKGVALTFDCRKCLNKRGHARRKKPWPWEMYQFSGILKTCSKCGEEKPDTKFALRSDKRGLTPRCRTCMSRHIAGSAAAERAMLKYTLRTKYSATLEEYEETLKRQSDLCGICRGDNKSGRRLHIDHCHETGKMRGLLCLNCNAGLGQFSDSLEVLEAAVEYLRKNG